MGGVGKPRDGTDTRKGAGQEREEDRGQWWGRDKGTEWLGEGQDTSIIICACLFSNLFRRGRFLKN